MKEKNNFLLISLDDEKSKPLAEVLLSKICKEIINLLAQNELSEKDISERLNSPINTIEYNLKKLLKAELIEKSSNFFWSVKGKKIPTYKLSNKTIIISPKKSNLNSKIKSLLPVAILVGVGTFLIKNLTKIKPIEFQDSNLLKTTIESSGAESFVQNANIFWTSVPAWFWFLSGAIIVCAIFYILNWRKI